VAIGDGIRRNIAHVSPEERARLVSAILKLDQERHFPDGVSYFDKQEDIHKNAHAGGVDVHGGPAFIPWHRELCNRFEALLREVDSDLSLHYWDWTADPRNAPDGGGGHVNLFTSAFMGGIGDPAGPPFDDFESTEPGHTRIWRQVGAFGANPDGTPSIPSDAAVKTAANFADLDSNVSGPHGSAHFYIGGTLSDAHYSFHDPVVFLLHSNLDRLWAEWQTEPGHPERLAPATAYGPYSGSPSINELVQPWAGDVGTGATPLRPWTAPDHMEVTKTYKDISVVTPPCYDTLPTAVHVVTAENPGGLVNFTDVPQLETAIRAAVFQVRACGEINLRVTAGPAAPFAVHLPLNGVLTVPRHAQILQIGRLWFSYTGGPGGSTAASDVTIHCDETGEDFVFHLHANSIARPTVAVMLTLDQSGSMRELAGIDATTRRIDVLHQAATSFVQLVQDNNGVGIVSFDHAAHPGTPVTRFTSGAFDPAKATAIAAIAGISPAGATSIGNGLQLARNSLNPVAGYDRKALIVFTDGLENTQLWITDVAGTINDRTFAIGLGTAQQVSAGALTSLANHTQGYLLLSGPLSPAVDDYFRLTKYFLQVLAGATNTDIVTDPDGYLYPGAKVRVPFDLNETDIDATVILLSDVPAIRFAIETPAGDVMTPSDAAGAGAVYRTGAHMDYYRFNLPLALAGQSAQEGTWHALLQIDRKRLKRSDLEPAVAQTARGVRWSLTTQAFSNLRLNARVGQSSMEPGARVLIRAVLTEYGVPISGGAIVDVEFTRPDGSSALLHLDETDAGVFEVGTLALMPGVYHIHVRASGGTTRGQPFTREQLLCAVVVAGGDAPPKVSDPDGTERVKALCELLTCLLGRDRLGRLLEERGVDPDAVQRCLDAWCRRRLGDPSDDELAAREGVEPSAIGKSGVESAPSARLLEVLAQLMNNARWSSP
jgi:hypothetical protein